MNEQLMKLQLGLNIKKYRHKLGITQEEFSEYIGVTQRQVSLIEIGKSFPKPDTLSKIVNFFNCSISDLFDFDTIDNVEHLKNNLLKIIDTLPEDKLRILYLVGKNI